MIAWKVTEPNTLKQFDETVTLENVDDLKVRITHVLVTKSDNYTVTGEHKVEYPIIPGQIGVGKIVETLQESKYYEKNANVFLAPEINCGVCNNCVTGDEKNCMDMQVKGHKCDGYLTEFSVIHKNSCYPLPKQVSEEDALFIYHVAIALSVIDELDLKKGEHVCILGGNVQANILAQLIIYYQGVPIIVDNDSENLECAKNCGIFYTLSGDDKNVIKDITSITGGRLCKKVVYMSSSEIAPELIGKVSRIAATVAFLGITDDKLRLNCNYAFTKQLSYKFISSGFANIDSAINLLAQKVVNLAPINIQKVSFEKFNKQNLFTDNEEAFKDFIVDLI